MKKTSLKKRFVGAFLLCVAQASSADSMVSLGEQITDGSLISLASWDVSGSVIGRNAADLINITGGNAGFNSFFDSGFASLGDSAGAIGGAPTSAVSTLSQTFTLLDSVSGGAVASYELDISFMSVFDGDDSPAAADVFTVTLNGTTLFSQTSLPLPDCVPNAACVNNQLENDPFALTLSGLTPGTYTLTFALTEIGGPTSNTAAGVDNISVIATAHVPEPSTLALLGLGLLGVAQARRLRTK